MSNTRRSLIGLLAALVAALSVCLAAPSQGLAALPGVNVAGAPTADVVQEAINTGAKRIRVFALWRDLEPTPGSYPDNSPLSAVYDQAIRQMNAAGAEPIFVVVESPSWASNGTDPFVPSADPQNYANFFKTFAAHNAAVGNVAAYEVWNEPDEDAYWHPSPSAPAYAALLKAAYAAARPVTPPGTQILAGPTTGNNYGWISQLYDNGAGDSFDGVSVHTDTACLVSPPSQFYRENGRVARYTFLGYREVHQELVNHGQDKPVWMTELGWSSTNGNATSCQRGESKGKKPSGVSEADQADDLKAAYACLANDPYVPVAAWFTMRDATGNAVDELNHYGLLRSNGSQKPSYAAFKAVVSAGGGSAGGCGDFDPPQIKVASPTPNQQWVGKLDLEASATDSGSGVGRITFTYDGGKKIRNFTSGIDGGKSVGLSPWQGSGKLSLGKHTITVTAIDKNGNSGSTTINVTKVASLPSTLTPSFSLAKKVKCKGRSCTLTGVLSRGRSGRPSVGGKVSVEWQLRNKKGKYRKIAGGLKPASKRFTFKAKLRPGRYRVRVVYKGTPPYKKATSKYLTFRVG